ncbi:hypothetical protein P8452_70758 [Trifolium repens]|nr:hypothetical protein P8452_70758 [Trifolium repens]
MVEIGKPPPTTIFSGADHPPHSHHHRLHTNHSQSSYNRMKKFFPVLSKDKATSSANLEPSETQHPSEGGKDMTELAICETCRKWWCDINFGLM